MKTFQSHIIRFVLVSLVCAGIGLHLVKPVQAKTTSAQFARWLKTVVKDGNASEVEKQIFELSQSEASLSSAIRKASKIVHEHGDEFNLPFDEQTSSSLQIVHLLIFEWNTYQTGNGMGKALSPKTVLPNMIPPVDKSSHSFEKSGLIQKYSYKDFFVNTQRITNTSFLSRFEIIPLSGGIAIGAP